MSARGRSARELTRTPVSILPPESRRAPTIAAVIAPEPPSATGHP